MVSPWLGFGQGLDDGADWVALLISDAEVREALPMEEAVVIVEDAFRARGKGQVQMPSKSYLFFEKFDGDLRVMPGYLEALHVAGVKIVNSHPRNQERHGLPCVVGTLLLADPSTGVPLAIMAANSLTAIRTGAAGAVAAKYLSLADSASAGVIGAGVQARTQLEGLAVVRPRLEEVRIYDRDLGRAESLNRSMPWPSTWRHEVAQSPKEAVRGADIVVTTTPSTSPVVMADWLDPGTHINAIGADAPGKQELELSILRHSIIVVDDWEQAAHGGEISTAVRQGLLRREDIHGELGDLVAGRITGREEGDCVTVFDSTGLAIQDVSTGAHVLKRARARKMGREVDIWD